MGLLPVCQRTIVKDATSSGDLAGGLPFWRFVLGGSLGSRTEATGIYADNSNHLGMGSVFGRIKQ